MSERPIIFSGPMVRAILDGGKTQTRRVVKGPSERPCPHGSIGDCLWVRETFATDVPGCPQGVTYRADHVSPDGDGPTSITWTPSIYMPRRSSRITLEITGVRAQRIQAININDVLAEGVGSYADFKVLWDSINAKRGYGWAANPWVWAITFRRIEA